MFILYIRMHVFLSANRPIMCTFRVQPLGRFTLPLRTNNFLTLKWNLVALANKT